MSKYAPLEKHLQASETQSVPMTFGEIETIIQDSLPASARKHRAWWSNNPANSVITNSWLAAGFKTADVNIEQERVVFIKTHQAAFGAANDTGRHPVFGCMKDTVSVAEGVDLTEPALPEWADTAAKAGLFHE